MRFFFAALALAIGLTVACKDSSPSSPSPTTTTVQPGVAASVISINYEIIERNNTFWRFSWRASVAANRSGTCFLRTKYFNSSGRELHQGTESLNVTQGTRNYTGQDLVDTSRAPDVRRIQGEISSCF